VRSEPDQACAIRVEGVQHIASMNCKFLPVNSASRLLWLVVFFFSSWLDSRLILL
jgi:hypothetical protein